MITWHVVYTQPLKESIAQQNLLNMGYEVYAPKFKKNDDMLGRLKRL